MEERHFYHSFPRPHSGDTQDSIIAKGLGILESIKKIGLVLAPEIVEWSQPLNNGTDRITRLRQKRISFTELPSHAVAEHGEKFGPVALQFNIDILRSLGALPVIYMPQSFKAGGDLSALGTTIVTQLGDLKHTIEKLHELSQVTDLDYVKRTLAPPSAAHVTDDYTINLQTIDESKTIVHNKPVSANHIRDMLQYIDFKNAPLDLMIGVLSLVQALFYPTDDTNHDAALSYYRQREWRIVGGLLFNGVPNGRSLSEEEKTELLSIDERFWNGVISDEKGSFRRVDEAVVIDNFNGKPVTELISKILVPPQILEHAKRMFGNVATSIS